jgi:GntR family transcriptional regulator / MocR family aminotransferase
MQCTSAWRWLRQRGTLLELGNVFFAGPLYPCPFFRLRLSSIAPAKIDAGLRALADAATDLPRLRPLMKWM